jgi:hypothetical protein
MGGAPGRGGCGTVPMECHNHVYRNEGERDQPDPSFAYGGKFLIPDSNDQLTLEFGGKPHSTGKDRSGYKVAFDEKQGGVFMWKQDGKNYSDPILPVSGSGFSVRKGSKYDIMITKQNVGGDIDMKANPLRGIPPYTTIPGSRAGYRNDGLIAIRNHVARMILINQALRSYVVHCGISQCLIYRTSIRSRSWLWTLTKICTM